MSFFCRGGWLLILLVSGGLFGTAGRSRAADQTIGLFLNLPGASGGYTLFSPLMAFNTYLINNEGHLVHLWEGDYVPGNALYLRENGNLVRLADPGDLPAALGRFNVGGDAGLIQEFDWEGNLIWELYTIDANQRSHHDIALMPNGNVLIIVWEYKSTAEAIAAGRDPSTLPDNQLWPEKIVELQPGGGTASVVWEWRVWDHLIQDFDGTKENFGVVGDHPGLIDVNFGRDERHDWLHANALDYNPALDQIVLSVPTFDEVWIIDHSTTTAEAAGHSGGNSGKGGDLLYRWGNPAAYRAGTTNDQTLFFPHGVNWIAPGLPGAGNLLLFNNQRPSPEGRFSSADEIITPVDLNGNYAHTPGTAYGPAAATWVYEADPPTSLSSDGLGGAQRLPNGNTLICEGRTGRFLEVTSDSELVWDYKNPVGGMGPAVQGTLAAGSPVFRAFRYPPDYPAFDGRELTSLGPVERPADYQFEILSAGRTALELTITWASVPAQSYSLQYRETLDAADTWTEIETHRALGTVGTLTDSDPGRLGSGTGFYRIESLGVLP